MPKPVFYSLVSVIFKLIFRDFFQRQTTTDVCELATISNGCFQA